MKNIRILLFLISSISFAQYQAANWYFGDFAGINFNNTTGVITALTDGQLQTDEGCTSISDENGNLLFYTDGITVYTGNHQVMQNGSGLLGNPSSTQSAIIIPKPGDPNMYYIFTQSTDFNNLSDVGFRYSEVDMRLDNGLGGVVRSTKNTQLRDENNVPIIATEKLAAVLKDCESGNILVATQVNNNSGSDLFYVFEVSNSGITLTGPPSSAGMNSPNNGRGYLKFSPDGSKLVSANIESGLFLYDFDTNTGQVTFRQRIIINDDELNTANRAYGVEFSSNSNVLYVSTYNDFSSNSTSENNNPNNHFSALLQFNVSLNRASAVNSSQVILEAKQGYRSALQLGPDGKIYKTESSTYNTGLPYLSVIEQPNVLGTGCNYQENVIFLDTDRSNRLARQGLPPFIASFFTEKIDITNNVAVENVLPLCSGDTFTLVAEAIPGAIYTWTQNNNPIATPTPANELEISTGGNYSVFIEVPGNDCESKEGQALVTFYDVPTANPAADISVCADSSTTETASFDLTEQNASILGTQNASVFNIRYFRNLVDAQNNSNEIVGTFENTENPQTIYARIQNDNNPNCFDITSFNLRLFAQANANPINNLVLCDDDLDGDPSNGQITTNLADFNVLVLGTQSPADFNVSYHNSQADANTGASPLPTNYYNQTPFAEEIFVRVENVLNTNCFSTTSFNLTVNALPEAFNSNLTQCDTDGTPDGQTTFNLNEAFDALTGGNPMVTVAFYSNTINAETDTAMLNANAYQNTSNPEVVIAKVINTETLCYSLATLSLEVSTTQIQDYVADGVCEDLAIGTGLNTFNLDTIATNIQTINNITFPVVFYASANDALLEQNPLASPFINTIPFNQTIYARAENNNACYGIAEVTLIVNQQPTLRADETLLYCLNSAPQTIILQAGVIGNTSGNYSYAWSSGQTTSTIAVNEIGSYTVTVTNSSGCTETRTITVNPSDIATIQNISVTDGLSSNNNITVTATGEGEYEYALFDANGNLYAPYQNSNVFTNIKPGIYTVTIRDIKNDCGEVSQKVSVIGFPKVFTPNGDGTNDMWNVQGVSALFQPNTSIQIFNRFGKLLTEISALSRGWDGTYNGELMPNDDYWFVVKLQDGRIFRSHFTLKR
ncbi:T9SS type B sorting domain-containing protein [Bizionia sediminis]|uniref:T9SS type B sorting domain-containing protein n=1 Tax=Bizionia sediminis TaxID=1737064 RepID=A0ABW5KPK9_9FLAO